MPTIGLCVQTADFKLGELQMRRVALLLVAFAMVMIWGRVGSAQDLRHHEIPEGRYREVKKALLSRDFDSYLKIFGKEKYYAEEVFTHAVAVLEGKGWKPVEMLPYYEFYQEKWGVYAYSEYVFDFEKLTEARFELIRHLSGWQHTECCAKAWWLAKNGKKGEALEILRKAGSSCMDCEMCALSFSTVFLPDRFKLSLEGLLETIPLAEEMIKRFPRCINTALAIETLANLITSRGYHSTDAKEKAFMLREALLAVAESPLARCRVLPEVAHGHVTGKFGDSDLAKGEEYYREVLSYGLDKHCKQEILFDRAGALYFRAIEEETSLDPVIKAYTRAIMVDPQSAGSASWFIGNLAYRGCTDIAMQLSLEWFEKATKDASFTEVAADMLHTLHRQLAEKNPKQALELAKKVALELPFNGFTAWSLRSIANYYEKAGDEHNMLLHLEKLASLKHPPEDRRYGAPNTSSKQGARQSIAEYYEKKGNLPKALEWYRRWRPFELCGC